MKTEEQIRKMMLKLEKEQSCKKIYLKHDGFRDDINSYDAYATLRWVLEE